MNSFTEAPTYFRAKLSKNNLLHPILGHFFSVWPRIQFICVVFSFQAILCGFYISDSFVKKTHQAQWAWVTHYVSSWDAKVHNALSWFPWDQNIYKDPLTQWNCPWGSLSPGSTLFHSCRGLAVSGQTKKDWEIEASQGLPALLRVQAGNYLKILNLKGEAGPSSWGISNE